ncbi:MAG: ABC transporter substrate-binding protein [Clostridiales bacterium]|nr:ABC transporter substrate-binding protein [Candidatus Blautia equi]
MAAPVLAQGSAYPVTITDQAGREITIEQEPESLISAYYISTSLIMALGLTDRLAGIETGAELRPIYGLSAPALLELPNVGSLKEFDLEACAALEPDLVILPMKLKESAAILEELGFTVLIINPESQELLKEAISIVAKATNTEEKAAELLGFINTQEQKLEEQNRDAEAPRVYLSGNSDFLSTAGNGMYQNELITLAGGANVAGEIEDTYWVESSYEQILSWDPEYIIMASAAKYTVEDVLADENLAVCTAVQNGNVYHIPSDLEAWDSPVPAGILGAVWMSGILHPEQNAEEDSAAVLNEFYKTFYGVETNEN